MFRTIGVEYMRCMVQQVLGALVPRTIQLGLGVGLGFDVGLHVGLGLGFRVRVRVRKDGGERQTQFGLVKAAKFFEQIP